MRFCKRRQGMGAVASLLIRFPGKRIVTPCDFNARITHRGPWAHEPNLERSYVVRNISERCKQLNPPVKPGFWSAQRKRGCAGKPISANRQKGCRPCRAVLTTSTATMAIAADVRLPARALARVLTGHLSRHVRRDDRRNADLALGPDRVKREIIGACRNLSQRSGNVQIEIVADPLAQRVCATSLAPEYRSAR